MGDGTSPSPKIVQFYLISTFAPASSSFFLALSDSALLAPSRTGFGAPSTSALASARPKPAFTSRTALITAIFLSAGTDARITSNEVLASTAGAAAPPAEAAAPGAPTATGAAAETPQVDSSCLTRSAVSRTVNLPNCSTNAAMSAMLPFSLVAIRGREWIKLTARQPTIYFVVVDLAPAEQTGRKP